MPLEPIGSLDTGRTVSDDFVVGLVKQADGTWKVLVSCAVKAGDKVIANYNSEDITDKLTATQQTGANKLGKDVVAKVKALLGL